MADTPYDDAFFALHVEGARDSARETIPLLFEFVRPTSVVDVGCGLGAWLAEFAAAGVSDYLGIDGEYVDRGQLLIESARFLPHDLAQPIEVGRRFDLAVSVEVAEHLSEASADGFVASLVRLAPVVLFSAAIPCQGGTGHINEQWPDYWVAKFAGNDFAVVDCLRRRLWNNAKILPWYRQNMLVFVDRKRMSDYPALAAADHEAGASALALVHPEWFLQHYQRMWLMVRDSQRMAMRAMLRMRKVNLVAFPDWNASQEEVTGQLRALLAALVAHPDLPQMSLALAIGSEPPASVHALLHAAAAQLPAELAGRLAEGPDLSTLDESFGAEQWGILLSCVQGRVSFAGEDARAIAAAGAQSFPAISLAAIESMQPFEDK